MNIFVRDWALVREPWEEYWPFTYPEWSNARAPHEDESAYTEGEEKSKGAGKRTERRIRKKAAKLSKARIGLHRCLARGQSEVCTFSSTLCW